MKAGCLYLRLYLSLGRIITITFYATVAIAVLPIIIIIKLSPTFTHTNIAMRTIIFIAFFLVSKLSIAQDADSIQIVKLLEVQRVAWNKGDLETFMDAYWRSDSLMFIGKSGVTYGWKPTLENYQKGYPDTASMGKLDFNILHVDRLSKTYFSVVGKWHLTRSIGNVGGHFTLLFQKIAGKWVIISDHSS